MGLQTSSAITQWYQGHRYQTQWLAPHANTREAASLYEYLTKGLAAEWWKPYNLTIRSELPNSTERLTATLKEMLFLA